MPIVSLLGSVFALSELGLTLFKRAKKGQARSADRGSLWLLWGVVVVSVNLAYALGARKPEFGFGPAPAAVAAGVALFVGGLALRWYSIMYLGRYFTVNVAIATDHRVIDTGPYRYIRHPSYTGALMAFAGLGLALRNWAALAVMVVPIALVFLWRIRVEEAALAQALGDTYRDYMSRTKRLVPAIY
ncbi:MAG TPA: isoprenylcysteine carboxylmethyltransferase family protein [Steroidobacteraceae bacterium]|jgi:protein-S-isoprenylcysteine O-methyltransferase